MSTYAYKVRNFSSGIEKGTVQASSEKEAVLLVRKLGGIVVEVKEQKASKPLFSRRRRLPLKEKIIFTEQLSVMLKAGITLVQALRGLQEESSNKTLAAVLEEIVVDVEGGTPFSSSLAKHPSIFSNIYVQMVKSAERSGTVADILGKLTIQQQKEYDLKGKVKGALMYPAIISVLLLGVIIMVITFILPKLTGLFADSGVQLPITTRILIGVSDLMVTKGAYMAVGLVIAIIAFQYAIKTEKGGFAWDAFKIKVPVLGSFLSKSYMARFTQSFASLSQAGIPVLEIFDTAEGVVGNKVYQRELHKIAADVENGIKVSTAIRKSKYFPGMIGQLVAVGEQSGDLAGVFQVLGDFFEKEVDGMAKNLSTILEPIIMIVMGFGVGFVLISVLQPIMSLTSAI